MTLNESGWLSNLAEIYEIYAHIHSLCLNFFRLLAQKPNPIVDIIVIITFLSYFLLALKHFWMSRTLGNPLKAKTVYIVTKFDHVMKTLLRG